MVPEAYDRPREALHAGAYYNIGMPESGRCAGMVTSEAAYLTPSRSCARRGSTSARTLP